MQYRLRLFAALREYAGMDEWCYDTDLPAKPSDLLSAFFRDHPRAAGLREVTRLAVNHRFCRDDLALAPEDELALIPPVSGG